MKIGKGAARAKVLRDCAGIKHVLKCSPMSHCSASEVGCPTGGIKQGVVSVHRYTRHGVLSERGMQAV